VSSIVAAAKQGKPVAGPWRTLVAEWLGDPEKPDSETMLRELG
jgi:hypothetical protein